MKAQFKDAEKVGHEMSVPAEGKEEEEALGLAKGLSRPKRIVQSNKKHVGLEWTCSTNHNIKQTEEPSAGSRIWRRRRW